MIFVSDLNCQYFLIYLIIRKGTNLLNFVSHIIAGTCVLYFVIRQNILADVQSNSTHLKSLTPHLSVL